MSTDPGLRRSFLKGYLIQLRADGVDIDTALIEDLFSAGLDIGGIYVGSKIQELATKVQGGAIGDILRKFVGGAKEGRPAKPAKKKPAQVAKTSKGKSDGGGLSALVVRR